MSYNIQNPAESLTAEDWQALSSFFNFLIEADRDERLHNNIELEGKCDDTSRKITPTKF